ncbi:hypothetical protein Q5H92_15835 [Hymenobacter sp. M29]|uniref:Uncharacterized protein n=1 Tax=Hymenobacter mellowenesis TaxID=3063995 RepID=A0ABT9AGM3_9BACT|nr:hypothetical protein [Hymenobacter sp. M29]MDO7847837.1 hypothetical protein [Hymenobacter sp. M29]
MKPSEEESSSQKVRATPGRALFGKPTSRRTRRARAAASNARAR